MFQRIKGLREFKYEHGGSLSQEYDDAPNAPEGIWEPYKIVRALALHASWSLVTLDLTQTAGLSAGDLWTGQIFVGPIHEFKALRRLRVDYIVFIQSRLEEFIQGVGERHWTEDTRPSERSEIEAEKVGISESWGNFVRTRMRHRKLAQKFLQQRSRKQDRIHRLVDVLPISLEDLTLVSTSPRAGTVETMFDGLATDMGRKGLPRLERVILEGEVSLDEAILESCGRHEICIYALETLNTVTSSDSSDPMSVSS